MSTLPKKTRRTQATRYATLQDPTPAIDLASPDLLEAARNAIAASLPSQFELNGRIYWLRCAIALAKLELFDAPTWGQPITRELFEVHSLENQNGGAPSYSASRTLIQPHKPTL
jgi:hypothetical protein